MIECGEKLIENDSSDPISSRRENVACRCLRACWQHVSVTSFVLTFSRVPLRFKSKLSDASVAFFMCFNLVYSPEFFAAASGRKSTRKIFRQATELIDLIHHVFVGNPTSPPFAFNPCPFHMGVSFPLRKRLLGVFWSTHGCKNPKSKKFANPNFVYL